eukprot:jgi/Bigna1/146117/aug1.109_g20825
MLFCPFAFDTDFKRQVETELTHPEESSGPSPLDHDFTWEEAQSQIAKWKPNKAAGPDEILPIFIKSAATCSKGVDESTLPTALTAMANAA